MHYLSMVRNPFSTLRASALSAVLCLQVAAVSPAAAHDDPDCRPQGNPDCGQHNMMLVGNEAAFVSHLPMFHNEHRFQVIARVQFTDGRRDLGVVYDSDRADHPEVRMYTVRPEDRFALSRLVSPVEAPERRSFTATVFRGHLERGGVEIGQLEGISADVAEIVYAEELTGADGLGPDLQYILFGTGDEAFLAHRISAAPDFDQIVSVSFSDQVPPADALRNGAVITFPERQNLASDRLRSGERAAGELRGPADEIVPVTVTVEAEPYFEEGELLADPDFNPTELELEAGF